MTEGGSLQQMKVCLWQQMSIDSRDAIYLSKLIYYKTYGVFYVLRTSIS